MTNMQLLMGGYGRRRPSAEQSHFAPTHEPVSAEVEGYFGLVSSQ